MPRPVFPRTRVPVVLVPGLFGFDRIQVGPITMAQYFPGIVEGLSDAGNRVFVPFLSPTAGIDVRAGELRAFLDQKSPNEPVHIVAHSMGGLDSRYMISRLGMGDRVLSLTTLGTPHRGTAFADWGVTHLERLVKPLLRFLGMPSEAFYDLTPGRCDAFCQATPDLPSVRYFSVAGEHDGSLYHPEWWLPYQVILEQEGPNDGLVSVQSARHGEDFEVWAGDHFHLINWSLSGSPHIANSRTTLENYARIVDRLRSVE